MLNIERRRILCRTNELDNHVESPSLEAFLRKNSTKKEKPPGASSRTVFVMLLSTFTFLLLFVSFV